MTNLKQLLSDCGIRKVALIDDAFDDIPKTGDLDTDSWAIFFDDIKSYEDKIRDIYPTYDESEREDLQVSNKFISALWERKDDLTKDARTTLFEQYEKKNSNERQWLDNLFSKLELLELECVKLGRQFMECGQNADLVIIDLFLGFEESEDDMAQAINGIKQLVKKREATPPLVILMSRSSRLERKKNEFRDHAGLLGSTFRVVSKDDLTKAGKLETLLTRLASHYEDAKRVARFVHAWDTGLDQARESFIQIMRRLDLPDLAQIRALLLDFEGQKLGEYLIDVADRVLQHEIEAQSSTISASQELNKIDLRKYPAPHLTGSPDLQELMHRMIFQHVERQKLSSSDDTPQIQFGDILRCKDEKTGAVTKEVLLVVTPACDLIRSGTKHILVLPGDLITLAARDWSYGTTMTKTPILMSSDGSRNWIKWNLKSRQTIPLKTLYERLHEEKGYEQLGRLREIYAVEIQQKMLADMGHIGQPANTPATFPVSISLYVVSPQAKALPVTVEGLDKAVCFVGKDEGGNRVDHLVLNESACDALKNVIQNYSFDDVHSLAQESLTAMKIDFDFFEWFERGLIKVPVKNDKLQPEKGNDDLIYMHVVRNEWKKESKSVQGNYRNGPFIMKICDIGEHSEA